MRIQSKLACIPQAILYLPGCITPIMLPEEQNAQWQILWLASMHPLAGGLTDDVRGLNIVLARSGTFGLPPKRSPGSISRSQVCTSSPPPPPTPKPCFVSGLKGPPAESWSRARLLLSSLLCKPTIIAIGENCDIRKSVSATRASHLLEACCVRQLSMTLALPACRWQIYASRQRWRRERQTRWQKQ